MRHSRLLLLLLFVMVSCITEYRTYKRVGGNHLQLENENEALFWFNGIHGNHPRNPMFADIQHEFENFNPGAVLVEGHYNNTLFENGHEAIKNGESAFVAHLARQSNIPCFDIEPGDSALNEFLIGKYGKKDVLAMYIIRQMVQWGREKKDIKNFEELMVNYVRWEDNNIGFFSSEITLDSISKLLEPYTGIKQLSNKNWIGFDAHNYLYFSENRMNTIYNDTSNFRNIYLVQVINKKLGEYNKVFVMMGFDHAIETRLELENIFVEK